MNRFYILFLIACLSLGGAIFSFWSEPARPLGSRTLVDFAGRTVHLQTEQPKRMVSLSPSNTEILYALGLEDRLMAVSEYSDYPPEAKQKPRIGGFQSPDIEQIVSLQPDIVFAGSLHTRAVQALTAAGVPVAVVEPRTMQEVLDAITLVGEVTGEQTAAERVTAGLAAKLTTIRDLVAEQPKQRVFLEVWDEPFMTIGAKSYLSDIVTQAGGINVAGDKPTDYMTSDFEYLYSLDPDIYIAVNHIGLGRTLKMSSHPWMQNLRAVRSGQVHYVPDDILSRPGPRSFEGLVVLTKILHPEIMRSWRN
jgi:iron complex transport system substrate-binding protein